MKFQSNSSTETEKIGKRIGRWLQAGDVLTLSGPLGAGKTTLVRGIARGLGVGNKQIVSSPTFVMVHEYEGREKIYHLDWYRLARVRGSDAMLSKECFNLNAVTLVEWPERGKSLLPTNRIEIVLKYKTFEKRLVEITIKGSCRETLLDKLR